MAKSNMIFPGVKWQKGNPADFGFTGEILDAIDGKMKFAEANGVLIRNGYLVAEWNYAGPREKTVEIQSCTKSITSMMLGLAIRDGLVPGLDAKVKDFWPGFEGGPYADRITFRHLVTMTSGISAGAPYVHPMEYVDPGNIEPGKEYHYTNAQPVALACALTYIYGRELKDVLMEKVLDVVGMEYEFDWMTGGQAQTPKTVMTSDVKEVAVNIGSWGTYWTASDLARIGHLYLNGGSWKDMQLLPAGFVRESFTDIPHRINAWRRGTWLEKQPQNEDGQAKLGYGLGWWTSRGSDIKSWNMGGNGGQFCLVLPEYGVVMTKINGYQKLPFIKSYDFVTLLAGCLK
ncbi:MAG TPA: serine hydrolase [bacterium]|nr:serine hydrolase [bacterium]